MVPGIEPNGKRRKEREDFRYIVTGRVPCARSYIRRCFTVIIMAQDSYALAAPDAERGG